MKVVSMELHLDHIYENAQFYEINLPGRDVLRTLVTLAASDNALRGTGVLKVQIGELFVDSTRDVTTISTITDLHMPSNINIVWEALPNYEKIMFQPLYLTGDQMPSAPETAALTLISPIDSLTPSTCKTVSSNLNHRNKLVGLTCLAEMAGFTDYLFISPESIGQLILFYFKK